MKRLALLAFLMLGSACAFAQVQAQPNYQGLWWNSPASSESGWGLNIAHQGDILFATWFTYDSQGKGMWLVVPRAELQRAEGDGGRGGYGMNGAGTFDYVGSIYRTTGPAFDAAKFDPAAVTVTPVGEALFSFTSPEAGMFSYIVNGVSGVKTIVRQVFGAASACTFGGAPASFTDLWWRGGGSESGWGINIAQQGGILFATWFTYAADGKGLWLVASDVRESSPGTWTGALYSTTGPAFGTAWDVAKVKVTTVGTLALTFSDIGNGTLTATVNGITVSRPITRQVFSSPASACR